MYESLGLIISADTDFMQSAMLAKYDRQYDNEDFKSSIGT